MCDNLRGGGMSTAVSLPVAEMAASEPGAGPGTPAVSWRAHRCREAGDELRQRGGLFLGGPVAAVTDDRGAHIEEPGIAQPLGDGLQKGGVAELAERDEDRDGELGGVRLVEGDV